MSSDVLSYVFNSLRKLDISQGFWFGFLGVAPGNFVGQTEI